MFVDEYMKTDGYLYNKRITIFNSLQTKDIVRYCQKIKVVEEIDSYDVATTCVLYFKKKFLVQLLIFVETQNFFHPNAHSFVTLVKSTDLH